MTNSATPDFDADEGIRSISTDEQNRIISRRCVFFIGGYEPNTPASFFGRLAREMRHFEATWGVETSMSEVCLPVDNVGCVTVVTTGADAGKVTTDFHFLGLESIVGSDFSRPLVVRVFRYLMAHFDYWLSGTAFSIFARSWRFGLYFLYPFAVTCFFFVAVLLAASAALRFAAVNLPGLPALIALLALLPLLATRANDGRSRT